MMLPIAASQTLAAGDAVIWSSGQLVIALANSATLAGVVARNCSGLASDTKVPVWADPNLVFVGRIDDADAITEGGQADIIGATGVMQIDADGGSTNVLRVLRRFDEDETDDTAGERLEFRIDIHAYNPA